MKNKKSTAFISLVLAVIIFLTSGCSNARKNNTHNELTTSILAEEKGNYQFDTIPLACRKDNVIVKRKPIEVISLNEKSKEQEKYQFGYITNDTAVYNTILDKEEKIEAFQKVIILDRQDNVTLVGYIDGDNEPMRGLVLNEMLKELPDTFIEVDISDQTIKMYIDGEKIIDSLVVTGMSYESPTPIGCFDIDEKASPTFLKGYDGAGNVTYSRFVDYWMPFNGGIGLHDAEYHHDPEWGTYHGWRNPEDFGGNTYTYNGSHGCVNLLNEVAKEIYENSEVGTKVLVHK